MNISNNINFKSQNDYNVGLYSVKPSFKGIKPPMKEIASLAETTSKNVSAENLVANFATNIVKRSTESVPKIADNLHDLIVGLAKRKTLANGKDAVVHSIPNHDDLVLRIEKTAIQKMDSLGENLSLVPIKYDKQIAENKNFGLPLYFVTEKGSAIDKKGVLEPMEALSQPDKIMVLKKMKGEHPSEQYWNNLATMMGYDDLHPSIQQLNNFQFLGYVRANFGNDAAITCLENCKNGITKFEKNQLGEGSPEFNFVEGKTFYKNYRNFADSYIKSLKDISEFPQKAYDKAVEDILSPKDFIMDFQHTGNTFVDLENQEFNFMDFCFDKSLYPKYHYENPIKEFRNVLMGKCFARQFKTPRMFMIYPQDIEQVKIHSRAINEKVNLASPERFRSESPFK